MSASTDFSRRFFADFIASRIKARGVEEAAASPRRAPLIDAGNLSAGTSGQPAAAEARPAAPRPDVHLH